MSSPVLPRRSARIAARVAAAASAAASVAASVAPHRPVLDATAREALFQKAMLPTYELAVALLRASSGQGENFVISPFSFGSALALVHDGAKGDTQMELSRLLGRTMSPSEVSSLYAALTAALNEPNSGVTTLIGNRLYVDKTLTIKAAYQSHVERAYGAGAESIDLKDGDGSAKLINAFVHAKTGGMFGQSVTAADFLGVASIIVNATYFKGEWATKFEEAATQMDTFYGMGGNREERFMVADSLSASYTIDDELIVVALSYKDPAYSLVLLMPSGDFGAWRENLTADRLHAAISGTTKGEITLSLPRFRIDSTIDGKAALEQCGVGRAFEDDADLSGISDDPLYISRFRHSATIEVNESGTRAVAGTIAGYSARCESDEAEFNRPFLVVLTMQQMPLYIGQVV